jgi:hypothetical protein
MFAIELLHEAVQITTSSTCKCLNYAQEFCTKQAGYLYALFTRTLYAHIVSVRPHIPSPELLRSLQLYLACAVVQYEQFLYVA